jgi:hypothetical protein
VDGDADLFHAAPECPLIAREDGEALRWCCAGEAHLSRLMACGECSTALMSRLPAESIPSGAKRARGLPAVKPYETGASGEDSPDAHAQQARLVYGEPEGLKGPRFATRSVPRVP